MFLRDLAFIALLTAGCATMASAQESARPLPATADKVRPLLVGKLLPAAQLVTSTAETIDLKARLGGKAAVLVFYRGGW